MLSMSLEAAADNKATVNRTTWDMANAERNTEEVDPPLEEEKSRC
jgi:hypothetical protein